MDNCCPTTALAGLWPTFTNLGIGKSTTSLLGRTGFLLQSDVTQSKLHFSTLRWWRKWRSCSRSQELWRSGNVDWITPPGKLMILNRSINFLMILDWPISYLNWSHVFGELMFETFCLLFRTAGVLVARRCKLLLSVPRSSWRWSWTCPWSSMSGMMTPRQGWQWRIVTEYWWSVECQRNFAYTCTVSTVMVLR